MFSGVGSALVACMSPSEKLSIARRRVVVAENAIKEWKAELESAEKALKEADPWPQPQGWY